jgi:hypothetical protein
MRLLLKKVELAIATAGPAGDGVDVVLNSRLERNTRISPIGFVFGPILKAPADGVRTHTRTYLGRAMEGRRAGQRTGRGGFGTAIIGPWDGGGGGCGRFIAEMRQDAMGGKLSGSTFVLKWTASYVLF